MIKHLYISAAEHGKLIRLPERNKNFIGVGVYVIDFSNPEAAWYIGIQLIGEFNDKNIAEPKYMGNSIQCLHDFFREHANQEGFCYGVMGVGTRSAELVRAKPECRGFSRAELSRFLMKAEELEEISKSKFGDYMYMIIGPGKAGGLELRTARLAGEGGDMKLQSLPGQPEIVAGQDEWFKERWNSLRYAPKGLTSLLLE